MTVRCELDHVVVVAPSLAMGRAWVEERLGVALEAGGRHVRMGTHNALLRLGPTVYLEVISIDPDLPPPGRPRWFALDRLRPSDPPRLATWVARTDTIEDAVAACPEPLGEILPMTRDDLTWRIAVPPDGALRRGGVVPGLIGWESGRHPASRLEDRGCTLLGLSATVPAPERDPIEAALASLGLVGALELVTVPRSADPSPRLVARIATPAGEVELG